MMAYERWRNLLVVLLALIAAFYLIGLAYHIALSFSGVIFLYFTAWLISFLLSPVVNWLCTHRFSRLLAVLYVYFLLAALLVILVLSVVPTVLAESVRFVNQLPDYGRIVTRRAYDLQLFAVAHTPLPITKANLAKIVADYNNQIIGQIQKQAQQSNVFNLGGLFVGNAVNISINIVQASLSWLLNIVIILVLSFYMTLDGQRLTRGLIRYLPESWATEMGAINASIARSFGGYIRGQVLLALIYAVLTYLTLLFFHVPFAVVLAVFAGVMMLIPFIGTFLAVIPPLVVAGVAPNTGSVLWLAVALFIWQQVTLNVLAPRILSDSVGMHPLLVFLGVLMGAKLAGPWGAIFGVPVLGVTLTIAEVLYRRFMQRHLPPAPPAAGEQAEDPPDAEPEAGEPPHSGASSTALPGPDSLLTPGARRRRRAVVPTVAAALLHSVTRLGPGALRRLKALSRRLRARGSHRP